MEESRTAGKASTPGAAAGSGFAVPQNIQLRLVAGAWRSSDGELLYVVDARGRRIGPIHPGLDSILSMLIAGASGVDIASAANSDGALAFELSMLIERLASAGLIEESLMDRSHTIVTAAPSSRVRPRVGWRSYGEPMLLSRFAAIVPVGDELQLRSPLASAVIRIFDESALRYLHAICSASSSGSIAPEVGIPSAESFIMLLYRHHLVERAVVAESQRLVFWEPHDLLFHSLSRYGTGRTGYGATMRFGNMPQPPVPTRVTVGGSIPLAEPDGEPGPSLYDLLATRRSVRSYGQRSISLRELGAFLGHCARVQRSWNHELPDIGIAYERSYRPYPSAGGIHPLEIYIVAASCEGLASGLYHYDAVAHSLEEISADSTIRSQLLADASMAAPLQSSPQLLLVITACFGRMQWRYESMAYASILKETGCLIQTMYLVSTAMGLAPCALGGGNPSLFARAIGIDELIEGSVGELLLGSRDAE